MKAVIIEKGICQNCGLIVNGELNGVYAVANKYFPQDVNSCPECGYVLKVKN